MSSRIDVEQTDPEDVDHLEPLLNMRFDELDERHARNSNRPASFKHQRQRHSRLQHLVTPLDASPPSGPSTPNASQQSTAGSMPQKWRRGDRRIRRLNTELLEAIEDKKFHEIERLLEEGASPDATCRLNLVSACHLAALSGGDALSILLKHGADKHRLDLLGRTPLHLAAWAGNAKAMAVLLDFPEDMQDRVENESMSSDAEEEVKKLCFKTKELANVRSDLGEIKAYIPKNWRDNIDHDCIEIQRHISFLQPGWTPLHVASSAARRHCTRLLLAVGADPNICDVLGRTVLDVAGTAYYYDEEIKPESFTEVIKMLLKAGGRFNTMKPKGINNLDTPLHTAVELENTEAIKILLEANAVVTCLNKIGETPLHVCVKKRLEETLHILVNHDYQNFDPMTSTVDVKDKFGHTVLQAAVQSSWVEGVCIALEDGADVTIKAHNGETPIHSAAALGDIDVLTEILSIASTKESLDCPNDKGETPLFKAVTNGHLACVKAILDKRATIRLTLPGNVNVLHIAAEHGYLKILEELLERCEKFAEIMINAVADAEHEGFGPIHFAVFNNHPECVELLLSRNADIRLRTTAEPHKSSTPLHLSAAKNFLEISKILIEMDKTTMLEVNSLGWYPLHTASFFGSRDVISYFLTEGADLSAYTESPKNRRSAIDMIINVITKPVEFLEEIFDSCITTTSENIQDIDCALQIDYRVLVPCVCDTQQMKVINALLKTGNRQAQKRLLLHPLIESFLFLKWKVLLPFFYVIVAAYGFFVLSLTIFIVSVFFYKDTREETPIWFDDSIWSWIVYFSIGLVLLQELLYLNVKSRRYYFRIETWIKFSSLIMAAILPSAVSIASWASTTIDWPRHVATIALLLSWIEMMFLLSRFPDWGLYVLMFRQVATNVVKILLTFAFLVIGFSLCFMIQFRSQVPFEDPWAALVKTMVMMTSEFEYEGLFDEERTEQLTTSIQIVRAMFLLFLLLAAIVLMNLLVGVAVSDINDLVLIGKQERLAKQVEFLSNLDTLVYNKVFSIILSNKITNKIKEKRNIRKLVHIYPNRPTSRFIKPIPKCMMNAIIDIALAQNKQKKDELDLQKFLNKLDEMHEAIIKQTDNKCEAETVAEDKPMKMKIRHEEIIKNFNALQEDISNVKIEVENHTELAKSPIEKVNVKLDQMSLEIEEIKQFLSRLESKFGAEQL